MGCIGTKVQPNENCVDSTHFENLRVIGQGGFGQVFAVENRVTDEILAKKGMKKQKILHTANGIYLLKTERYVLSKLRSSFILKLLHCFQDQNYVYFILPYMSGGTLHYYLYHRPKKVMDEELAKFWCAQIILGVQALHAADVVYRDLKPENILLDKNGNAVLSDFGISAIVSEKADYQTTGKAGTPGYIAPEMLRDGYYSFSVDFWSFGVMLYEFLHQEKPFNVHTEDFKEDYVLRRDISNEAKDLIGSLLVVDVDKRLCNWDHVKAHPWFDNIDWKAAEDMAIDPPFKPSSEPNIDWDADYNSQITSSALPPVSEIDQERFHGIEFNTKVDPLRKSMAILELSSNELSEDDFEANADWIEDENGDFIDGNN